jgi:methyl-accepting chemotaxis protein
LIEEILADADEHIKEFILLINTDNFYSDSMKSERVAAANNIQGLISDYKTKVVIPVTQANLDGRREDVIQITGDVEHISNGLISGIENLKELAQKAADDINEQTGRTALIGKVVLGILSGVTVIISIVFAVVIEQSVVHFLQDSVHKVTMVTDTVTQSSSELSKASHALAESAGNQAASIEETSATMNETASMIKLTKENTQHAARLSSESERSTMDSLKNVEHLMEVMTKLNESSSEIEKIADTITSLASQTNILALNASVEAVRVGEAGKAFAVVAEEVRTLATKSSASASHTTEIIKENIMLAMQGVESSKVVSTSLNDIHKDVLQVNMLLSEISTASEEQSRGVDQIAIAVATLEDATQSTASIAEESSATADYLLNTSTDLHDVSERLEGMI